MWAAGCGLRVLRVAGVQAVGAPVAVRSHRAGLTLRLEPIGIHALLVGTLSLLPAG